MIRVIKNHPFKTTNESNSKAVNNSSRPIKIHDYTRRYWGHDYAVTRTDIGGKPSISGWGLGIRAGDRLLIKNNGKFYLYAFDSIRYLRDPYDMWNAEVSFLGEATSKEVESAI